MNWDLSKLYTSFDDEAFVSDINIVKNEIEEAKTGVASIESATDLVSLTLKMQHIEDTLHKLSNMVFLSLAADSNCKEALGPRQTLLDLENAAEMLHSTVIEYVGNNYTFVQESCAENEILKAHQTWFDNLRHEAEHILPKEVEAVALKLQQSGGSSWCRLRDELFSSLSIDIEIRGEKKNLPLPAIRDLANDPDPEVRKTAYEAEIGAYPRIQTAMAACLNGIEGEAITMAGLRNYPSVLDWSLGIARMDRETLNALLDAMKASLPMFRRYFRLKNKLLGNDGPLKFYDLFAPVGGSETAYTLEEAKELLIKVFSDVYKPIADVMRRAFEEYWIDAYPRDGKEGGAFCSEVHALKMSYILTNFGGNYSGVSTLAHELGHAYHASVMDDASSLLCDVPMPLAETASTMNELLLSEYILANATTEQRIAILEQQLSDAAQVIVDILSRFLFESEVIERRKSGTMCAEELCEIMRNAQLASYGDGLDSEVLHPYMWACKPHYYDVTLHFYNYPYAFGQLFAAGLFSLYKEKGEEFWPMYDRMLRSSGAESIRDVTDGVGIDVSDKEFWDGSISFFEKKLDQLEQLVNQA